jgi:hypothetical protein
MTSAARQHIGCRDSPPRDVTVAHTRLAVDEQSRVMDFG